MAIRFDISVGTTQRLIGTNPELSDLCNPSGRVFENAYFVTAREHYCGEVEYAHYHLFDNEADATALANKVRYEAWKNGWTPVGNQYWSARKLYGAESWSADDELELMDDDERDHFFNGK